MGLPNEFSRTKLPPTVWSLIAEAAREKEKEGGKIYALHIGDTHLSFPSELTTPIDGEELSDGKGFASHLNRYGDTFGEAPLRELVLKKVRNKNNLPAESIDCIQITGGATSGLETGFNKLLSKGADVLVLAPYWSILREVADAADVRIIEVPFFDRILTNKDVSPFEILEQYITPKTEGIYINVPSNPTGMLLESTYLESIAQFAIDKDLWVFSDEAYEDFIWNEGKHISIGSLPSMYERTLSVFTFSKCFGASGIRCGYAVADPAVISQINRGVVGAYYQPGRLGQLYAWRGMMRFDSALSKFRSDYQPTWEWVKENLKVEAMPCDAGFYFFVALPESWIELSPTDKVQKMLDCGIALAPGEYFGDNYRGWARMCFTILPLEQMKTSVEIINERFK